MRVVYCSTCNKELINRRSHIQTCSSSCRSKLWRASKLPLASVKLIFNSSDYELIQRNAEIQGFTLEHYLQTRALLSEYRA